MAASPNLLPWFETARIAAKCTQAAPAMARLLTMRPSVLELGTHPSGASDNYSALIPVSRIMPAQPSIEVLKKAGASANATVWGS